eukprot:scaffold85627_cov19-Tisochrysis_lutea.AAC.1
MLIPLDMLASCTQFPPSTYSCKGHSRAAPHNPNNAQDADVVTETSSSSIPSSASHVQAPDAELPPSPSSGTTTTDAEFKPSSSPQANLLAACEQHPVIGEAFFFHAPPRIDALALIQFRACCWDLE